MPNYDFQTLNDKDFEELSRDLLQKHLSITFESFKQGRDSGIDLYHSASEVDGTVVQAKHWFKSGYPKLRSKLINDELHKIRKLLPKRYILVTSVPLSPLNKKDLMKDLHPFVHSTADIFGKDDLNNLLGKFPEVEEQHFKLWLSSTSVLRTIINNGIKGRSQFVEREILQTIARYVSTQKFHTAVSILNDSRFLVIIGEPGIGKTVLAKMLLFQLLGNGYELVKVTENITEAEDVWNPSAKQVFYFDDFLGANYFEIIQSKNNDSSLVSFIKRVQADPSKRIILTSRTVILNQAKQGLQRLNDAIINLAQHEIKIDDYNEWDKAKILYNHIFFSDLEDEYKRAIFEEKNYLKIIKHRNFSPRLIEFITTHANLGDVKKEDYWNFILNSLTNPSHVWKYQYEKQIDDYARFLIGALFSLGSCKEPLLQAAFEERLEYEIKNNGFKRENNIFNIKVKELLGSFFTCTSNGEERTFSFFNPSIVDFLINYFNAAPSEKWRMFESACYLDQFTVLFNNFNFRNGKISFLSPEDQKKLYSIVSPKEKDLKITKDGSREVYLLDAYHTLFHAEDIKQKFLELLSEVKMYEISHTQFGRWIRLLKYLSIEEWWKEAINKRWREIIDDLFKKASDKDELEEILALFEEYEQSYLEYKDDIGSRAIVRGALEEYWASQVEDIKYGRDEVRSYQTFAEVKSYIENVYENALNFNDKFEIQQVDSLEDIFKIDSEELAQENEELASKNDYLRDRYFAENIDKEDHEERINELFLNPL